MWNENTCRKTRKSVGGRGKYNGEWAQKATKRRCRVWWNWWAMLMDLMKLQIRYCLPLYEHIKIWFEELSADFIDFSYLWMTFVCCLGSKALNPGLKYICRVRLKKKLWILFLLNKKLNKIFTEMFMKIASQCIGHHGNHGKRNFQAETFIIIIIYNYPCSFK